MQSLLVMFIFFFKKMAEMKMIRLSDLQGLYYFC